MNPTKLGLPFFEFCTIFYGIYTFQQNTNTILETALHWGPRKLSSLHTNALSSHIRPWKEWKQSNVVQATGGGAAGQNPAASAELGEEED
jgi:hypothetical protein